MVGRVAARPARDDEEKRAVEALADRHVSSRRYRRARMIRQSWAGFTVAEIASELGYSDAVVRVWIHRFNAGGVAALCSPAPLGRPRRLTEDDRSRIVAVAESAPPPGRHGDAPGGARSWTLTSLTEVLHAQGIAVSRTQVWRVVQEHGSPDGDPPGVNVSSAPRRRGADRLEPC